MEISEILKEISEILKEIHKFHFKFTKLNTKKRHPENPTPIRVVNSKWSKI